MFIKRKNNYKFKISHIFNDIFIKIIIFLKEKLYWINDKVVDVKKNFKPTKPKLMGLGLVGLMRLY